MTILDTSLLVPLVRTRGAEYAARLAAMIGDMDVYLTVVTEIELLQGAKDEIDWRKIEAVLTRQDILQPAPADWRHAARTYFDLHRNGLTVRRVLDCLIAEIAVNRGMMLLHNDRDFEVIATIRPLIQRRVEIETC